MVASLLEDGGGAMVLVGKGSLLCIFSKKRMHT